MELTNKGGRINPQCANVVWWQDRKIEHLYQFIIEQTGFLNSPPWRERMYCFANGITEKPKCGVCGNPIKMFYNFKVGYGKTCSRECNNLSTDRTEKIKMAWSQQTDEQRKEHTKKIEDGFFEKYGVSNISKTQHFHDVYKQRMNDKYGVDNYFEMTDRVKESMKIKYGVDNPQQVTEIKQRTLSTVTEKYGEMLGACPAEQTKKTCMERYGSEHFFASEAGKMSKENLKDRYGWTDDRLKGLRESKNTFKPSKESLRIFLPLYVFLRRELGIERKQIHFGISGSKESFLWSPHNGIYFYDFCVKTQTRKYIIEYNGTAFHPKTPINEEWSHPYNKNLNASMMFERDLDKKRVAIDNGYEYLILWSDNSIEENLETTKAFAKEIH